MGSNQEPRPRVKRWAPKTKTGCQTCRQRRIKCDETKPACGRCVRARFACPGYPSASPAARPSRQLAPLKPRSTAEEELISDFFCTESVYSICSGFQTQSFLQSLLQYPALWHASLAIGGMHKRSQLMLRGSTMDASLISYLRAFSISHYNTSVQLVLQTMAQGRGDRYCTQEMVLMASILYGVIGAISDNFDDVKMHTHSSVQLFNQWEFWQRRNLKGVLLAKMITGHLLHLERSRQSSPAELSTVVNTHDTFASLVRMPFSTADETCMEFDLLSEWVLTTPSSSHGGSGRKQLPEVGRKAHTLWQKKLVMRLESRTDGGVTFVASDDDIQQRRSLSALLDGSPAFCGPRNEIRWQAQGWRYNNLTRYFRKAMHAVDELSPPEERSGAALYARSCYAMGIIGRGAPNVQSRWRAMQHKGWLC